MENLIIYITVTVSAYNPLPSQTDDTPLITASNSFVREGICALSRDLEKRFDLRFGDLIHLEGIGACQFQDRMHWRKRKAVDLFMWEKSDAVQFGKQQAWMMFQKRNR